MCLITGSNTNGVVFPHLPVSHTLFPAAFHQLQSSHRGERVLILFLYGNGSSYLSLILMMLCCHVIDTRVSGMENCVSCRANAGFWTTSGQAMALCQAEAVMGAPHECLQPPWEQQTDSTLRTRCQGLLRPLPSLGVTLQWEERAPLLPSILPQPSVPSVEQRLCLQPAMCMGLSAVMRHGLGLTQLPLYTFSDSAWRLQEAQGCLHNSSENTSPFSSLFLKDQERRGERS